MTPKTPFCVVTLLAIAFALLFYIVWTFPWLKESLLRRLAGLLIVAACLYLFGDYVWPSTQNLNQSMTAKIETPKDEAKPVPKQDTTDQVSHIETLLTDVHDPFSKKGNIMPTIIMLLFLVFPNGQVATQTATFHHKAACQYAIAAVQNPTTQFQPENVPYVVGFCVEDTNVEPALPGCATHTVNGRSIVECED